MAALKRKIYFRCLYKLLTPFLVLILSSLVTLQCGGSLVFAGSGLVSTVGGATFVQGADHFWVTSARPTFSGITTAAASITGTVGSQTVSATADSLGNWSWTPATELTGDNQVSITSGSTTVAFTLTIGSLPESIASGGGTLAPAGSVSPTIFIIGGGIILFGLGGFGLIKSRKY